MSKLIGTNPNQVPSNADLGTAAFMDKKDFLLSKGSSLSAIDAVVNTPANAHGSSTSAVDVFIYDTSKDSDGGAWRKRTQHTSWYNERLNTPLRGSRREFPAVAVIVVTQTEVTIYDGDDPNLPMWMKFDFQEDIQNGTQMISVSDSRYWTSCHMVNAQLAVGMGPHTTVGMGLDQVNFISDKGWRIRTGGGSNYKGTFKGNISQRRNSISAGFTYDGIILGELVDGTISDVAMTVLPNAPIDSATGLPIPTIAAATDGGVSVIKDDGTVVDLYRSVGGTEYVHQVAFNKDNSLFFSWGTTNGQERHLSYYETIPSSDDTEITDNYYPSANMGGQAFGTNGTGIVANNGVDFAGSSNKTWLSRLMHTKESALNNTSSVAFITSTYNTGWMNGDIKLATLSDTDATDVTGSELITNGSSSFSGTSGWYLDNANQSSGTIATLVETSGQLIFTHSDTNSYWDGFGTSISTVVGKSYTVTVDIAAASNMNVLRITDTASQHDTDIATGGLNTAGTYSYTFTAISTTTYLHWNSYSSSGSMTLNSMTVRLAEEDRSVNGNGLQVFGTVTKNPVATGADLVAYSGFSASNQLYMPFNSDLAFGNNDYSASIWFKNGGTNEMLMNVASDGTNQIWGIRIHTNDQILVQVTDDGFSTRSIINTGPAVAGVDSWQMVTLTRVNNALSFYLNGVYQGSGGAVEANLSDPARVLIGMENSGGAKSFSGSLALARISETAPSAEQIKKIYEDEKVLFQENAKATLYGSSDAVTALAYDDDTELLHAGTSAGRSVFQGLRRIDNTTDAVGSAISASNGMVAED